MLVGQLKRKRIGLIRSVLFTHKHMQKQMDSSNLLGGDKYVYYHESGGGITGTGTCTNSSKYIH